MADQNVAGAQTPSQAEAVAAAGANGRYRVVHLSDLHFGAGFDADLWTYVRGQLKQDLWPVDLVVVSGDIVNSPSFFGLGMARRELQNLERELGCRVVVVRGNHDAALWGNVAVWPLTRKFDIVFDGTHADIFDRLPTFSEHRAQRWWRRWLTRTRWALVFAYLRSTLRLRWRRAVGEGLLDVQRRDGNGMPVAGDVQRVLVVGFDSCRSLRLATGRVAEDDALRLDTRLAVLRQARDPRWMCPRIAVVHHHVMPIPFSETRESATSFEPFLVLRNAGTLARQLAGAEFDLVLHGHKHYWHAVRAEFDGPDQAGSTLAVIGAGSGTVRHDEPGRNSFNVIDLMPNGSIVHRPVFFGRGMTADAGRALLSSAQPRLMLPLPALKRRALAKAVAMCGCCADLVERRIDINESGSATYQVLVQGFKVTDARSTRRQTIVISLSSGAVPPGSARLHPVSVNQGHRLDTRELDRSKKLARLHVDLGRDLYSQDSGSTGVDFGVICQALNTFAVSEWEARQLDDLGDNDWVGLVVRQPMRRARLRVRLPVPPLVEATPEVVVRRPACYPALSFDSDGHAIVPEHEDPSGWELDQDMTNLERHNLRALDGKAEWQLDLDAPMVGFRYEIRWRVARQRHAPPLGDTRLDPELARASARVFRHSLLAWTERPLLPRQQQLADSVQAMLDSILRRILQPEFRAQMTPDEELSAALFVYDDRDAMPAQRGLRLVLQAGTSPAPSRCDLIPLNEGVTGAAFKTWRQALYVSRVEGDSRDVMYVYYPAQRPLPEGRDALCAVVAVPVFLGVQPDERSDPELAVGVLTLSSNAHDSGLLRLRSDLAGAIAGPGAGSATSGNSALWTLASAFINSIAAELRGFTADDVDAATAGADNASKGRPT